MRVFLTDTSTSVIRNLIFGGAIFLMFTMAGFAFYATRTAQPGVVILGLAIIMMVFAWIKIRNSKQISYDDSYLYVTNLRNERKIELKNVRSLNEGSLLSFNSSFEIELHPVKGIIEKITFFPSLLEHLDYSVAGRLSPKLLVFKKILSEFCDPAFKEDVTRSTQKM